MIAAPQATTWPAGVVDDPGEELARPASPAPSTLESWLPSAPARPHRPAPYPRTSAGARPQWRPYRPLPPGPGDNRSPLCLHTFFLQQNVGHAFSVTSDRSHATSRSMVELPNREAVRESPTQDLPARPIQLHRDACRDGAEQQPAAVPQQQAGFRRLGFDRDAVPACTRARRFRRYRRRPGLPLPSRPAVPLADMPADLLQEAPQAVDPHHLVADAARASSMGRRVSPALLCRMSPRVHGANGTSAWMGLSSTCSRRTCRTSASSASGSPPASMIPGSVHPWPTIT